MTSIFFSISGLTLMAGGATSMFDWTQFGVVAAILGVQMWINHNTVKGLTDAVNNLKLELMNSNSESRLDMVKLNEKLDNVSREIIDLSKK